MCEMFEPESSVENKQSNTMTHSEYYSVIARLDFLQTVLCCRSTDTPLELGENPLYGLYVIFEDMIDDMKRHEHEFKD